MVGHCNFYIPLFPLAIKIAEPSSELESAGLAEAQLVLAQWSQRLIGELIGYPWTGVRRRRPSSFTMFKRILL